MKSNITGYKHIHTHSLDTSEENRKKKVTERIYSLDKKRATRARRNNLN